MNEPPQIEGFTLLRQLGSGGMATVWLARQHSLDREVAIKVLSPALATDPDDVQRFFAEARIAASLHHPNLVQVFDAGCQNGRYYYVMELVRGYDTGQWLRRKGRIPLPDALAVAESVALALDHGWRTAGLIHCDIKPANVMIDADGTVKVTDLGVARRLVGRSSADAADDAIVGTPAYMAPEQAAGRLALDCRADIYSLGAMLYHYLSGRMLFEGESEDRVMELQQTAQAPDIRAVAPDVPLHVCLLLEKFLAKPLDFRPRDWAEALRDLRRARRRLAPGGNRPPPGASTMRLNASRDAADDIRRRQQQRLAVLAGRQPGGAGPGRSVWRTLFVLAIAAAMVLAFVSLHRRQREEIRRQEAGQAARRARISRSNEAYHALSAAERWIAEHPGAVEEGRARLRQVAADYPGTPAATQALKRCAALLPQQDADPPQAARIPRGAAPPPAPRAAEE